MSQFHNSDRQHDIEQRDAHTQRREAEVERERRFGELPVVLPLVRRSRRNEILDIALNMSAGDRDTAMGYLAGWVELLERELSPVAAAAVGQRGPQVAAADDLAQSEEGTPWATGRDPGETTGDLDWIDPRD